MTTEQMLKMALSYKNMSQAQLARELNTTPPNFNQKVKRNTLTREDLEQIARVLGADLHFFFRFPDGTEI